MTERKGILVRRLLPKDVLTGMVRASGRDARAMAADAAEKMERQGAFRERPGEGVLYDAATAFPRMGMLVSSVAAIGYGPGSFQVMDP